MSVRPDDRASREERLDKVVAEYLAALDAGDRPDPESWIARYPEFAEELREFAAENQALHSSTESLRELISETQVDAAPWSIDDLREFARQTGAPLLEDYELLDEIGRGGMGAILRARQKSLNRLVAVKVVLAERFLAPQEGQRFRLEAEAAAGLDHPNIVPVYEVGHVGPYHFYCMKLIEGDSLAGELDGIVGHERRAAELIETVARAVHHAHQRGLIHRDLKPSNILLDGQGRPYVADFGLAKRVDADGDLTMPGAVAGTLHYMAPEQAAGHRELTTAVDIYGLGVILYQLLTGELPFVGQSQHAVFDLIQRQEPTPPSRRRRGLDRDLQTICLKCLEKDPNRRYASAAELADDLGRWLGGEPIFARKARWHERLVKWGRRRPLVAALSASIVSLLALGVSAITWQWREAESNRQQAEANHRQAEFEREQAVLARQSADAALQTAQQSRIVAESARREAETAQENLQWRVYLNQISMAERALDGGDFGAADGLLRRCPKSLRCFEWHHLRGRYAGRQPLKLLGHDTSVTTCAVSRDGTRIASGSSDGELRVWGARDGKLLRTELIGAHVTGLAFSLDGSYLVMADIEGKLQARRSADWSTVWEIDEIGHEISAIRLSANGTIIGVAGGTAWAEEPGEACLVDVETGDIRRRLPPAPRRLNAIAFGPDDQSVAVAGLDGVIRICDVTTGELHRELSSTGLPVNGLAFAPQNRRLASISWYQTTLWDLETGEPLCNAKAGGYQLAFSSSGKRLAVTGAGQSVTLLETDGAKRVFSLGGHHDEALSLVFTPDGHRLISGSRDCSLIVWDARLATESSEHPRLQSSHVLRAEGFRRVKRNAYGLEVMAVDRRRSRIAVADEANKVHVWDCMTQELLDTHSHGGNLVEMVFDASGHHLTMIDRAFNAAVWRPLSDPPELTFLPAVEEDRDDLSRGMSFGPKGETLATFSGARTTLWDAAGGQLIRCIENPSYEILGGLFSPDGQMLAPGRIPPTCVK